MSGLAFMTWVNMTTGGGALSTLFGLSCWMDVYCTDVHVLYLENNSANGHGRAKNATKKSRISLLDIRYTVEDFLGRNFSYF